MPSPASPLPPSRLRHVVVATDFSPASDNALRRADAIAHQHGATLSLLHVVEPMPMASGWGDGGGSLAWIGVEVVQQSGLRALERQRDAYTERRSSSIQLHCRVGQARHDLARVAAELGGDLLVLGGPPLRNLGERLFGSTVQSVVHGTVLPLLVCRRSAQAPWRKVLASTDFSPAADRAIVLAEGLAPEAEKHLLHAHEPLPEATLALLQPDPGMLGRYIAETGQAATARFEAAATAHPNWTGHFRRGVVLEVIEREAAASQADLLALGTRGHGRWMGALLGSVGQRLLAKLDADLLLVPEAA